MCMVKNRIIEYTFFFSSLALVGVIAVFMLMPFLTALALSAITVIICYPMYRFILRFITRQRRSLAALLATLIVFFAVVIPVFFVSTLLVNEFVSFYRSVEVSGQLPVDTMLTGIETSLQHYIPGFDFNLSDQLKQSASWFAGNLGSIFAGTVSVVVTFLIAMLGSFYLFKDGERLVGWLVSVSPLKDTEDKIIMERIARSIRSVATGTVLVAILQGIIAGVGFAIFGIPRPIMWGTIGALGALLPGLGTVAIMVPGVLYLAYIGNFGAAIGLTIWAGVTIVIVDNFISPYLMSRGNNLHPFVVLLAVLGGISLFGPIGFIIGPVMISLFLVLLELYAQYISDDGIPLKRKRQ
jgi:predicted PurR-regulated permease PerM